MSDPAPPDGGRSPGRAAFVFSQLYYYAAAVIGVGFVIGGAIAALLGVSEAILPREFETAREGFHNVLEGLAFGLPGLVTLVWHLRQARAREEAIPRETFWGGSLYYHLVALVGLGFMLGGAIGLLNAVVNQCYQSFAELQVQGAVTYGSSECYLTTSEAARNLLDPAIVLLVAVPVWWWHLRQGRKVTESEAS